MNRKLSILLISVLCLQNIACSSINLVDKYSLQSSNRNLGDDREMSGNSKHCRRRYRLSKRIARSINTFDDSGYPIPTIVASTNDISPMNKSEENYPTLELQQVSSPKNYSEIFANCTITP